MLLVTEERYWALWYVYIPLVTEERYWAPLYMPLLTTELYWALFYMPLLTTELYWALFYMPLLTTELYWAPFYMPLLTTELYWAPFYMPLLTTELYWALFYMPQHKLLLNLMIVLVQIVNKMGLKEKDRTAKADIKPSLTHCSAVILGVTRCIISIDQRCFLLRRSLRVFAVTEH
jgi:hypothetical protein